MKTLKDALTDMLLERYDVYGEENYDQVIDLAKNNPNFKETKSGWGSSGKAFELQLGKLNLMVDFYDSTQCLYRFVDNAGNTIYESPTTTAARVDWNTLFNDTNRWFANRLGSLNDGLKSTKRSLSTAEKKYRKTNKSDDFNRFNSIERQYRGIEKSIEKMQQLSKMY